jgi:small subunit ribosomal protein S21
MSTSTPIISGQGEGKYLLEVVVGPNESLEQALRRFSKMVQQTGVLAEARRREHYEPPSVKAKKKKAAKLRKSRKNSRRSY